MAGLINKRTVSLLEEENISTRRKSGEDEGDHECRLGSFVWIICLDHLFPQPQGETPEISKK